MIAIANQAEATLGWADALLARDGSDLYVWASLDGEPWRQALDISDRPGIVAATMAWNHTDPRQLSLALEVAVWLASRSGGTTPDRQARLTAWSAPTPPPGSVRVPHLVTVTHGNTETDTVVWELVRVTMVQGWLGTHLPDLAFVESNLDALLRLRAMVRTGRVPATPVAARLLSLLYEHDDLSIEFVYDNLDLFWVLLDAWKPL